MPSRSFCRLKAAAIAHGSGKAVLVWVFEPGLPSENSSPPVSIPPCKLSTSVPVRNEMAPSQAYPSTLTGAGPPVPIPDGWGPGRERVVVLPDARSRPSPGRTLFVGDFSSDCRALRGWPILAHLTNPSPSTRHSSGTWPRQGHPPSSPRYSTVLSRPFVVEARFSARPFRSGDARGRFGSGDIVDHFDGAPIDTGRTGEPDAPCARSGRIMVHDSQTLSLASAPRLAFWIWWMPDCARLW